VFAAYGLMVFLFETDATAELLGASAQTGIDISVPILAFAVVFGLSTDYGIFLFSRIAEARRGGLDPGAAIAEGLARTGQLITSAAVLFAVAVGAFAFSDLVIVKEFAVAVSIAVLLDATVVRGLLVPAVLTMLGERAWRGLGRLGRQSS
ncbi:MAG: MMPL family transporter, partial [Solirubrobacterales bacterium]